MEGSLVAAGRFVADKAAILFRLDEKLKAMTGIEEKMENLKELSPILDMLIDDIESHALNKDAVKDWLKKLKYLAYDLEDVVDCYDTEALRRQRSSIASFEPVRDFLSSNNQVVFTSKISDMIQAVTNTLDSILLQKSFLPNLPQSGSHVPLNPCRETHSCTSMVVIGREAEKRQIVDMLTKDDDDDVDDDESNHDTVKVIGIVGMGGLGKTTLAQFVYNDQRVKAHFASSTMWKVVGAEFDPEKIMKSVLQLATRKPVKISEIDLVMQELETALSGKKFLLVLDDVWNEDQDKWGVLKAALTCGARGSKILVTTRSPEVSSIMGSFHTHQLQQLSEEDGLSLFRQFAFAEEAADQKLMEIGEKIVKKCGGVPLAATSLGSMLRGTRDEAYWSSVSNSEIWQLRDEEQKVLAVLKLSYDTLPLQSKKCFVFGSLFPKDHKMTKDELIKLWIANDFVSSEGNFEAETVGDRVFNDLVLRSFFLLAPFQYDPHETGCSMHDLMHDLARSVSADVYWNSKQDSVKHIGKQTYHLQIVEGNIPNMAQVFGKEPLRLRTFMSLMPRYSSSLSINLLEVFTKLKYLRALDLTSCGIREIPTSIENLIHLRYLNLYYNKIEVLPDSITSLPNLQYLNLGFNHELRELPKKLVNMQNLRDLDLEMDYKLTHMPCGLSRLTNLRSLPLFIASDKTGACSITELEDLKLHGEMHIKFSNDFKNYSRSGRKILKNKYLNKLFIQFDAPESYHKDMLDDLCPNTILKKLGIWNYWSPQFPTWFVELQVPNLVEVCLVGCVVENILPLGNLQFLKMLGLYCMNGLTQMSDKFHGYGGFPSLQELRLDSMLNLEEWTDSDSVDEVFPFLLKLSISRCPKLKCMPRLVRIQHLELSFCSGSILSCIGRLTSLTDLRVKHLNDMTSFPSDCIRNLTSLTKLQIEFCSQLQSLPGDEMQYLEKLRSLTIERCDNLTYFPSEVGRLNSLRWLRLSQCPNTVLQPEELVQISNSVHRFKIHICGNKVNLHGRLQHLQHLHRLKQLSLSGSHYESSTYKLPSRYGNPKLLICCCDELESLMTTESASSTMLNELIIHGFSDLKTLPDWLQYLKSLRFILIADCPQLERVPRNLKNLPKLKLLRVANCPQLKIRCERETGEDWPIISHVPYIDIS